MMNDIIDRFKTDMSESDVLMPVLCSAWNILTVVNMKYGNLIFSYNTIELFYHIIKMMNNIIPTVARMTCIKTNSMPGDKVRLETKIIKTKGPVGIGEAVASVDGKVVVRAELTFMIG